MNTNRYGRVLSDAEFQEILEARDFFHKPRALGDDLGEDDEVEPTAEQMQEWHPDLSDPHNVRIHGEYNIQTGVLTRTEYTLERYREDHVNGIKGRNAARAERKAKRQREKRDALREQLIDLLERDPDLLKKLDALS